MRLRRVPRLPRPVRGPSAAAALWAVLLLAVAVTGADVGWCPFRRLTGLPCPTCGGTTALRHLLRGDAAAAFLANPFVLTAGLFVAALLALRLAFGRSPDLGLSPRGRRAAWTLVALAAAASWAFLLTRWADA